MRLNFFQLKFLILKIIFLNKTFLKKNNYVDELIDEEKSL